MKNIIKSITKKKFFLLKIYTTLKTNSMYSHIWNTVITSSIIQISVK